MILSDSGSRELHPETQVMAVCVDFVDLGMEEVTYDDSGKKMQPKCRVVFETAEQRADGKRFTISRKFTATLGENGSLRKFLESWRGRAFTADELRRFDTETLIGVPAILQIVHTHKGDRAYDNIQTVMRPMKGMPPLTPSGDYVRVQDRPEQPAAQAAPTNGQTRPHAAPQGQPQPPHPADDPQFAGAGVADDADLPF